MVSKRTLSIIVLLTIMILAVFLLTQYASDFIYISTKPATINNTALIDERVVESLNILYGSHSTEFVACLEGVVKRDGDVLITGITSTKVIDSEEHSVVFITCPGNTLGSIHSHPSGSCQLSKADAFIFGDQDKAELTGIICGFNRFAFYTREDISSSLDVKIVDI